MLNMLFKIDKIEKEKKFLLFLNLSFKNYINYHKLNYFYSVTRIFEIRLKLEKNVFLRLYMEQIATFLKKRW